MKTPFTRTLAVVAVVAVLLPAVPSPAHHSFAAVFDPDQPINLTGTVTEFEWMNPHAWIYIDVADDDGDTVNWGLELGSPNSLVRRGWSYDSLEVGDEITAQGVRARDGSLKAAVRTVTLSNGRELFGAQDESR